MIVERVKYHKGKQVGCFKCDERARKQVKFREYNVYTCHNHKEQAKERIKELAKDE